MQHMKEHLALFACPACGRSMQVETEGITCDGGGHRYPITDGIPQLFVSHTGEQGDVTEVVKAFYEKTPFPNYDDFDSVGSLMEKARRGRFARMLDDEIPFGSKVLEVGCGTGQLGNFLAIGQRHVFGTDMCLNSLQLANNFRAKNGLERIGFYQMNLFRPIFKAEAFDVVICSGVLHHTSDPHGGFKSISRLVRKGGHVVIGLYHRYGRLMTDMRRRLFNWTGNRFKGMDPYLRERGKHDAKAAAWFADQYKHPHESKHTMGEVLRWFQEDGYRFVNSVPAPTLFQNATERQLFKPTVPGGSLSLIAVQARMIITGNREGGFYIMIGRKES